MTSSACDITLVANVSYIIADPRGTRSLDLVTNTSSGSFIGQIRHKF